MKTGLDLLDHEVEFDETQIDFLRKTVAIMKILVQEAIKTSERFVKACGRNVVTGNDMYYALMYEAHEFFEKDFDEQYHQELDHEREHTYYTDDEEDSEEEYDDNNTVEEDYTESYSIDLKDENEQEFHAQILKYSNEWRNWFPDDPVKLMIKNSIDKTRHNSNS